MHISLQHCRFVFHDWRSENFPVSQLDAQVVFMTMSEEDCCVVKNLPEGSSCTCGGMNPGMYTFESFSYSADIYILYSSKINQ